MCSCNSFAPAAVLADGQGEILYTSGRTDKYLELAAGKANWNIFAMAREGLRYELTGAFHKAVRQGGAVTLRGLRIGTNSGKGFVDVTIRPIDEPEALRGTVMIVFRDVAPIPAADAPDRARSAHGAQTPELAQELQRTREELQTARQEMQTSQEELQSTNEELQSTNEELTTSKEEMQSLNEELQTVNAELQSRVDDFVRANNDMQNLLNSTDIATVFLDQDFNLRRYTTQATKIIRLIPGDVGRPLTDIVSGLLYPALIEDAREVLRTLAVSQKQIGAHDGSWFDVRIMPYRTEGGHTDGLVITFADITLAKKLEAELREREGFYRALFEALPVGAMVQDAEGSSHTRTPRPNASWVSRWRGWRSSRPAIPAGRRCMRMDRFSRDGASGDGRAQHGQAGPRRGDGHVQSLLGRACVDPHHRHTLLPAGRGEALSGFFGI